MDIEIKLKDLPSAKSELKKSLKEAISEEAQVCEKKHEKHKLACPVASAMLNLKKSY